MNAATAVTAVGVREARARFSELIDRARRGETVIITSRGQEVARLAPPERPVARVGGWMKGRMWIAPDFDDTPQDIIDLFEGSESRL